MIRLSRAREETLALTVYRENTTGRTARLQVNLASGLLAPPHLLIHRPIGDQPYYEVVGPEIYRVGVQPGVALTYSKGIATAEEARLKRFDYLVVGDASSIDGLAAPYDEEETDQVVHVERLDAGLDLFEFVNGGVKTGHGAEQKSATLDAGMRPAGGRSPSGGLIPA